MGERLSQLLLVAKWKEHGARRYSGAQSVDVLQLIWDNDDNSLKEKIKLCKYFLEDTETESGRHRVYNFAMEILDPKQLSEKLDVVFDNLKCEAKLKVAFGFVFKNVEDGSCR